jgi:acyl-CoA synthetase (NDP forming)
LGLIEGRDLGEMVDIAAAFLAWGTRLPAGGRVAVCTASGGGGGWMADACTAAGLEVPPLDAATRAAIDAHLPAYGTSQNPIDATAQAIYRIGYAGLADMVLPSPAIDAVILVISARSTRNIARGREQLARLAATAAKPILLWSYTLPAPAAVAALSETGLPLFTSLPNCARSMRLMADYRALRERFLRPIEVQSPPAADRAGVARALAASPEVLCEWRARDILACYGIGNNPVGVLASSAADAERAARAMGGAVALKVQSPDIPHKTEAGAIALHVAGDDEVRSAYAKVLAAAQAHSPAARIDGVLVQPMCPAGREILLGITRDPTFGPLLMVGLGGVGVEVLDDAVLRPVPLAADEAHAMLQRLRGARLLDAYRGAPAADVAALVDIMVRLARFAAEHAEEIAEIDLNPVIVHPEGFGASLADALIVRHAPSSASQQ